MYSSNLSALRLAAMNAATFSGVDDGGQASGKVRAATVASSVLSSAVAMLT